MHRILLLIDNKRHRSLLSEWLEDNQEVLTEASLLEEKLDLVILDGSNLKRLGRKLKERRRDEEPVFIPFLLVLQRRKGSSPVRYLGRVVDDLILKPLEKVELKARVANLLRLRQLSLELKKQHDLVSKLSVTDDVSGFYNTRYLHRYLDRLLASPKAKERQISLVFFDLDNFKDVVDTHGHMRGAKVLREVAQVVGKTLEERDRLVRYGGDEFIVVLPGQGKQQAKTKVENMRGVIASYRFLQKEDQAVPLTASFGLATFPEDAADKRELLAQADRCLFTSKLTGKNRLSSRLADLRG